MQYNNKAIYYRTSQDQQHKGYAIFRELNVKSDCAKIP